MMKHLPIVILASLLAAGGGYLGYVLNAPDNGQIAQLPDTVHITTDIGGKFSLKHHDGRRVSDQDFHGKYALIYFGYSYCPDVCPISLVTMLRAMNALPSDMQERITPIFITVDPDRDTSEELSDFVKDFDSRLIGLTGNTQEIDSVKTLYKVFSQKSGSAEDIQAGTYLVDHSSFYYLMNPDGSFSHMFNGNISGEILRNNLQGVLS